MDPSLFYTGLVADLYAPLRSVAADPEPYARFIAASGEPALELGCGEGEPLLDLLARGLSVEGLDSSRDMLDRCRAAAARRDLEVVLHHQAMESFQLPRRYRSIFLAGPTFNLLPDDETATRALTHIAGHLEPRGSALIPLFIPQPTPPTEIGVAREAQTEDGALLRCTPISDERDEARRSQTTVLRYERLRAETNEVVERPWVRHWFTQAGFRQLAATAGLRTQAVLDPDGAPATDAAEVYVFWLTADRP